MNEIALALVMPFASVIPTARLLQLFFFSPPNFFQPIAIQVCFSTSETLLSSTFARVNHLLLLTISSSMSGDGKTVFQPDDASRFKGSSADFEAAQQHSS